MKSKNTLYCSFSLRGLILFLLVLLPNLFFFATSNDSSKSAMQDKNMVISFFQNFLQMVLLFMLVIVKSTKKNRYKDARFISAMIFLLMYYLLWLRYFENGMDYSVIGNSFSVSMAMAAFPAIYFALAELWLNNKIGAAVAVAFGAAHVANTLINLK